MEAGTFWKALLVATISLARIGQGMYLSIAGPTLLYLAEHFEVEVAKISTMFILRSLGFSLGALSYSAALYNRKFNPVWAFGPGTLLLGLTIGITPWLNTLAGLLVVSLVSGFMFAFVDGAILTVYLRIWGEERARPFIHSLHFGISIGGLITPIIASPFLEMASQGGEVDPGCPDASANFLIAQYAGQNTTGSSTPAYESLNPVAWSYVIVGGFSVVVSLPLFVFWACRIENKISMEGEATQEGHKEEPIRDVWLILLLLFWFFFFNDTLEATYANYIYSVALCSGDGMTVTQAAGLNSIFWVGYSISRLTAIAYSKYFKPRVIIVYGIFLLVVPMIMMCIFGEEISAVMTVVTLYFGLGVGPLYPTGVTWASHVTDVSGKYVFVFMFAAGLDSMILLPLAGLMFDKDPFSVMYLLLSASIAIAVVFVGMEFVGRRHKSKKREAKLFTDAVANETSEINLTKL